MRRQYFNDELRGLIEEGNCSAVVSRCQEMLAELRSIHGETHPDVAAVMDHLAQIYFEMFDYPKAIQSLEQLLELDKFLSGEVNADYARTLSNLGFVYRRVGRIDEAESAYRSSLELIDQLPPEEQFQRSTVLANLSRILTDRQEYDEAQRLLLQAARDRYKCSHPRLGVVYHLLACLYWQSGRRVVARRAIQKAVRVFGWTNQMEHTDYAEMLLSVARFDADSGNLEQAQQNCDLALDIYRRARPPRPFAIMSIEKRIQKLMNQDAPPETRL